MRLQETPFAGSTIIVGVPLLGALLVTFWPVISRADNFAEEARKSRQQLAAQVAAVDGAALRRQLLETADNARLERWYAANVLVDKQWVSLAAACQRAADDENLNAYRDRRAKIADRLEDHERMARWCDKRKMADLAYVHWLHVLRFDSTNRAALKELDLTWQNGLLMTSQEAEAYQAREREWLKQEKAWRAKAKRLRRELEQGPPEERVAARQELHDVRDPEAVPALLDVFGEPSPDEEKTIARRNELVEVLGDINSPVAVELLAQVAVESPEEGLRYAAIDQLKKKPLETYVPALLAGLAMPVEASVSIDNIGNRVVGSYCYSQEKPGGKEYVEQRHSSATVSVPRYLPVQLYTNRRYVKARTSPGTSYQAPTIPGHGRRLVPIGLGGRCSPRFTRYAMRYDDRYLQEVSTPDVTVPSHMRGTRAGIGYRENPHFDARQNAAKVKVQNQALAAANELERFNQATLLQNERIANVLAEVTGETLSAFPKSWWNWWSDFLAENPAVGTLGTRQQLNAALLNQQPRGLARGTWVWTRRGKLPVEKVVPGDYVLSQEPRTGELGYKVVMALTASPPKQVSKISCVGAELHCAPGHVVWTTGTGWQRVSKLSAGQSLHGVATEARIHRVEDSFDIESYDLVVDGFHTLFVGEQGLLVHDATPVGPGHVALPGFSPAAVADAAQLAGIEP